MIVVVDAGPCLRPDVRPLVYTEGLEIIVAPHILCVVLGNEMHTARPAPLLIQTPCHHSHAVLVCPVISDEDNICEAVLFKTATDIGEQSLKRLLPQTDRARV